MGKYKHAQNNAGKNVQVASIGEYKEKLEEKEKQIKEFEKGPQPIPGCTCGQHTPNQFLIEKQVTKHYLKDRKRYVQGLKGEDPLKDYMDTFQNVRSEAPLVRLNMHTQAAMMKQINYHFNEGMEFYEQFIKSEHDLTYEAEIQAKDLLAGYEEYKEHTVKSLINSYIIRKRRFNREHAAFARKKDAPRTNGDSLDLPINETEGYITYMEEHFRERDSVLKKHKLSIAAEHLDRLVHKKLDGTPISRAEIDRLGTQMKHSLQEIKDTITHHRKRDLKTIQEKYDEVKSDCSLEHTAQTLIDIELRKREMSGGQHVGESSVTVNGSVKELLQTIGMETLICKLSTTELETLLEQF